MVANNRWTRYLTLTLQVQHLGYYQAKTEEKVSENDLFLRWSVDLKKKGELYLARGLRLASRFFAVESGVLEGKQPY